MSEISGKTFILTGASGGLGRALALALATEKVGLVLNARSPEALEKVAEEITGKGARADFLAGGARADFLAGSAAVGDVSNGLVKKAINMGAFLGFIQAAGVLHPGPAVYDLSGAEFSEIFEASVTASFHMAKAAFPHLIEAGEGIAVFFGSGAAERVVPGIGTYCAAKAAEEHLVRHLAAEAPEVTTFVFRPGIADTPMVRSAMHAQGSASKGLREQFGAYEKNGEILDPEIAARALVSILKNNPRRFHGKTATWRDGV
ncbi:Short-chain dehydrogenase/reductase family protein [Syntrophobacter sp. SbD1]|nr:Short-chain dehydrogenase/reductase family protein [Syntrophobacter sp. SbD1]